MKEKKTANGMRGLTGEADDGSQHRERRED
jgi:hypothetical protein